jgi:hypothetical protein
MIFYYDKEKRLQLTCNLKKKILKRKEVKFEIIMNVKEKGGRYIFFFILSVNQRLVVNPRCCGRLASLQA